MAVCDNTGFDLLANAECAATQFTEVATSDPISGVLVLFGALFVGAASVAFGGLAVGGILKALTDAVSSGERRQQPPQRG
jgi:hypothetical protein